MPNYEGLTFRIPCSRGGWNANPNEDLVPPEGMIAAVNINLHRGGRETRGGVEKVNGTPISGSPVITGEIQFRLSNGNEFIVTGTTDGKIYKDYTTLLHTFATTGKKINFTVYNNTLYVWNGANIGQTWDGAAGSTSDLANPAADWTGSNHPKDAIVHGRGAAKGLWAYGCPTDPKILYASETGTDDFSAGKVQTISVETGDGFGVVALEEFSEQLIAFGKSRPYLIDDSSATKSNWGYGPAQWEGGVAHERLLVRTPNDLIAMQEDGEIYSVIKAQSSGDFQAVSITRPAFIHAWIADNLDLSKIADFHMVYDPDLRAIRIFVVRSNQTLPDVCMVFFIDRPADEAWVQHRYYSTAFASCSTLVRVAAGDWKIYTGGQTGHVYKLESTTINDDGVYFYNGFTTPELAFNAPRGKKRYDHNRLIMRLLGSEVIQENVFIDGVPVSGGFSLVDENGNNVVDENGNQVVGYEFDSFTFTLDAAVALQRANRLQDAKHSTGKAGIRIQSEIFNDVINEKMFISQILYDHTPQGVQTD